MLDVSDLVRHPLTVPHLVTRLQGLPLVPVPTELVVRDPHGQIGPGHLDELTTRLDCPVGWVYLSPDVRDRADRVELAVSKAAGCWGVRHG